MTLASKGKAPAGNGGFPGGSDMRVSAADASTEPMNRMSTRAYPS
jgi:hypothetical protein